MSHKRLNRMIKGASSLAYLVVLLSAPGLDAVVEARTAEHEAHIEAQSNVFCSPEHDAYCQLCRILELPAAHSDRAKIQGAEPSHHYNLNHSPSTHGGSSAPRPQNPRAPPTR